ncbi:hypothetical protein IJ670_02955 [bacterium]|nr:hypothetical protein [bacterium]
MCFIRSSSADISTTVSKKDNVERHQADASLTKNSQNESNKASYSRNFKTTPQGLTQDAPVQKKMLLGE